MTTANRTINRTLESVLKQTDERSKGQLRVRGPAGTRPRQNARQGDGTPQRPSIDVVESSLVDNL